MEFSELNRTGVLLGIIGAALFSTKPIFIKFAYAYGIDTTALMALRMAFSLPFYLIFAVLAFKQRQAKKIETDYSGPTLAKTFLIGVAGYYVASFLDLLGLTLITAQFERLILFTYPIFVVILSAFLLGIKFTRSTAIALVFTYTGLAVIFSQDLKNLGSDITLGALLVLGAAIIFAGYVVFSKPLIDKLGSRLFTCFAMIGASFAILIHFIVFSQPGSLVQPWQVYGLVLAIAIFSTVLPTFFIAEAIARIGPGPASITGSIGPIFTTMMAVVLLGEVFTIYHFAGTVLIIAGVAWLTFGNQGST